MLNIDLEYKKGVLFMRLNGTLDRHTSFILDDSINKIICKAGIRFLLINFENLSKIDDFGINTILNIYNKYFRYGGKLMICGYNNIILEKNYFSNLLACASLLKNESSAFNLINI